MPNSNPYKPGDDVYPKYNVTTTEKIKSGVSITKGEVYTLDSNGYLVALTAASGTANINNLNGVFQAKDTVAAPSSGDSDGKRSVQVLRKRSRIAMYAPANVTRGDTVAVAAASGTPDPDKVLIQASSNPAIGEVFDILTVDSDANKKLKTADNDVILVELV